MSPTPTSAAPDSLPPHGEVTSFPLGVTTSSSPGLAWSDATRQSAFEAWLGGLIGTHGLRPDTLIAASADASFRRYFRLESSEGSLIIMDAPPPLEDVRPFMRVANLIASAGLHGPRVIAADLERGFLLLTDLGSALYLGALQADPGPAADDLMRDAIAALVQWQCRVDGRELPTYDDALLRRELALFPEWCVERECQRTWSAAEQGKWAQVCAVLIASALAQPRVAVHRDWMPRNLMVAEPNPGILDFQDAVWGPITYDVASLLRDAFISWDEERELDWAVRYWETARQAGLPVDADFGEFWRQLEWMGLQRHLKVLGIFCRLKHRDGKPKYADDLPRFFAYATKVALRYRPLAPLVSLLEPLQAAGSWKSGYSF